MFALAVLSIFLFFSLSVHALDNLEQEPEMVPAPREPSPAPLPEYAKYIDYGIKAATIIFGLLWLFLGYRLATVVLFLAGFATFFVIGFFVISPRVTWAIWIVYAIAGGAGIVGGLLFVAIRKLGYFLFGFVLGVLLAAVIVGATPLASLFHSGLIPLIVLLSTGLVVAIATVFLERPLLIVGTSFAGASLIGTTVDALFFGSSLDTLIPDLLSNINNGFLQSTSWQTYLILAGIFILSVVGIVVQFKVTAKGYHHGTPPKRKEDEYPLLIQANV